MSTSAVSEIHAVPALQANGPDRDRLIYLVRNNDRLAITKENVQNDFLLDCIATVAIVATALFIMYASVVSGGLVPGVILIGIAVTRWAASLAFKLSKAQAQEHIVNNSAKHTFDTCLVQTQDNRAKEAIKKAEEAAAKAKADAEAKEMAELRAELLSKGFSEAQLDRRPLADLRALKAQPAFVMPQAGQRRAPAGSAALY